jgi:hypothetical protein
VSSQYRTDHSADPILIHFSPFGINVLALSNISFKTCLIIPSSPKNSHCTWSSQNFVRISHLLISVPRSVRLHIIPHSHNDAAYSHIFFSIALLLPKLLDRENRTQPMVPYRNVEMSGIISPGWISNLYSQGSLGLKARFKHRGHSPQSYLLP